MMALTSEFGFTIMSIEHGAAGWGAMQHRQRPIVLAFGVDEDLEHLDIFESTQQLFGNGC
jgi:hypothetical protein